MASSSIRPIDRSAVHRICSGQVVLDLATCVKELVENALDAGAATLEVRLREHGRALIEVADDGKGIATADHSALAAKYHTSKIASFEDVASIASFGFRGEALSSICAVADVVVTTKTADQDVGARLTFDRDGCLVSSEPAARSTGTTVSVTSLFQPLPVRFKAFVRGLKKEYAKLVTVLQAYAVISTSVKIIATNQASAQSARTPIVCSYGRPSVADNVQAVFGAKQVAMLEPLDASNERFAIAGLISSAVKTGGKGQQNRQFLFLNGRPMDHAKITRTINELFRSLSSPATAGCKAMYVLDFRMSSELCDVNVTPDKRGVMLQHEAQLLELLRASLTELWNPAKWQRTASLQPRLMSQMLSSTLSRGDDGSASAPVDDEEAGHGDAGTMPGGSTAPSADGAARCELADLGPARGGAAVADRAPSIERSPSGDAAGATCREPPRSVPADAAVAARQASACVSASAPSRAAPSALAEKLSRGKGHGRAGGLGVPGTSAAAPDGLAPAAGLVLRSPGQLARKLAGAPDRPPDESAAALAASRAEERAAARCASGSTAGSPALLRLCSPRARKCAASAGTPDAAPGTADATSTGFALDDELASQSRSSPGLASPDLDERGRRAAALCFDLRDMPEQRCSESGDKVCDPAPPATELACGQRGPIADVQGPAAAGEVDGRRSSESEGPIAAAATSERPDGLSSASQERSAAQAPYGDDELDCPQPAPAGRPVITADLDGMEARRLARTECAKRLGATGAGSRAARFRSSSLHAMSADKPHDEDANAQAADELERTFSRAHFREMRVHGQFNLGFILASVGSDLFIVDQHAADEKFNFERLRDSTVLKTQPLIVPVDLELSAIDEMTLREHQHVFESNGFAFVECPTTKSLKLSAVAFSKGVTFGADDVHELIAILQQGGAQSYAVGSKRTRPDGAQMGGEAVPRPSKVRAMFAMRACRGSIMVGKALSHAQMAQIVARLADLDSPWNCPHGRPTMRHLFALQRAA